MNDLARFEAKYVIDPSGCWLWTASVDRFGYGKFRLDGRMVLAHRASFVMAGGHLDSSRVLDHLCRVTRCVNPAHLEQVTQRTNTLRGTSPAAGNAVKKCCPAGHSYSEANTYVSRKGDRHCRRCGVARSRRYLARRRASREDR